MATRYELNKELAQMLKGNGYFGITGFISDFFSAGQWLKDRFECCFLISF